MSSAFGVYPVVKLPLGLKDVQVLRMEASPDFSTMACLGLNTRTNRSVVIEVNSFILMRAAPQIDVPTPF
jgi:hypothetical protein